MCPLLYVMFEQEIEVPAFWVLHAVDASCICVQAPFLCQILPSAVLAGCIQDLLHNLEGFTLSCVAK